MKIKSGFIMREICGNKVVSAEGMGIVNFGKLLSLNETAAFLWEKLQGVEFTPETMADLLCEEYDVERSRALADAQTLCNQFIDCGIIEA